MRESLAQMLQKAITATNEQLLSVGRLGRVEADGSVTLHVTGTVHQAYVRLGADATEGVITAYNFGVPWRAHTPCRLLKLARVWIIIGLDYASDQLDAESYNVAPHEHLPRAGLGGAVSLGEPVTVRIQGGKITVPSGTSNVILLPESGTADNLDAILGGDEGQLLLLAPAADGDTITVRGYNNALVSEKNIDMRGSGNNRVMADRHDNVLLVWREATGHWEEAGPLTLNQLIGVVIEDPQDGDVLKFDALSGNWINSQP